MNDCMVFGMGLGTPEPRKEPQHDGITREVRRKQTADGLPDPKWEDGMKTHEEIKGYDHISNPTEDPETGKQGVGSSGYDFSKYPS